MRYTDQAYASASSADASLFREYKLSGEVAVKQLSIAPKILITGHLRDRFLVQVISKVVR